MRSLETNEIEQVGGAGALGAFAGAWVGGVIGFAAGSIAAAGTLGAGALGIPAATAVGAGLGATLGSQLQDLLQ
jgi:hypothetical protein